MVKPPSDSYRIEEKQTELRDKYGARRDTVHSYRQWKVLRSKLVQAFDDDNKLLFKETFGKMYYHKLQLDDG